MTALKGLDLPLLTASEVAADLKIPEKTVLNLARADRLPSIKIGRRRLFSREAVTSAVREAMEKGQPL
jgi:excisionase family DNA binding protein